ncbi:DUF4304 domain-containing protein [Arthrobacter sp. 1P04PC]|uniref:DUF4304 domain-containing protein n=1 Tax=unclassified Arthrobacter TaxID=235627 RepID=UPI0039A003E2
MDETKIIENTFAGVLKARGYRKRARNWFRTTSAGEYQVVNLQKSSWGGDNFYVNLGWHAAVPSGDFRAAHMCALALRAEDTGVIPTIDYVRSDGLTAHNLPGILLLNSETRDRLPETALVEQLTEVVVVPISDLMNRTPSLDDLVPLLTEKPCFVSRSVREELRRRGHELPWHTVTSTQSPDQSDTSDSNPPTAK